MKRILVGLSGTPYTTTAIRHTHEFAERHEAEVTGVTIVDLPRLANVGPVPAGAGSAAHDLVEYRMQVTEQRVKEAVAEFDKAFEDAPTPHRVVHETGDPFEQLVSLWRYHDLTVLGLRGIFEYGLVHHPKDYLTTLVKKGIRPILAVSREYREIKRVLIAYNGSLESAKAMKYFANADLWDDLTVRIACWDDKAAQASQLLTDAAGYCRAYGFEVETDHQPGDARESLVEYAEQWGADLIVMGATNRARIFKYVLGDTVLHTIKNADMPLFLAQ